MGLTEKQILTREEQEKKDRQEESMRALFDKYPGSVDGLEVLTPTKMLLESSWNLHSLFSVTATDPVYKHPDQSDLGDKYVRVIYHNGEYVATLNKLHFHYD